jgi:hypothetical protein
MHRRDPVSAPHLGELIQCALPFPLSGSLTDLPAPSDVFVSLPQTPLEHPAYTLQQRIPLDPQRYLADQLVKPLTRLFKPILGDHTAMLSAYLPFLAFFPRGETDGRASFSRSARSSCLARRAIWIGGANLIGCVRLFSLLSPLFLKLFPRLELSLFLSPLPPPRLQSIEDEQ